MKFRNMLALSSMMAAIVAPAAYAQGQDVHQFNIDNQNLTTAIKQLAVQSNAQIIFSDTAGSRATTAAVAGNMTTAQALDRLLRGTNFTYTRLPNGVIRVHQSSAQPNRARMIPTSSIAPVAPAMSAGVQAPEAPAAQPSTTEDIVVTGSRVISNGNNSPTPLTVVSAAALVEAQPAGVVQGLNSLPGLLGSINATSNVNSGGFAMLNVRGVGALRALIMVDGHRVGPVRPTGEVNVDVIPQMLLQRVDVVTGGASAVYGSDAVSGVVNFVTDTKFEGLKANGQVGISRYGDDRKINLGIAYGTKIGDRGHFEASYEYNDARGFLRSDRPFFDPIYTQQGSVVNSPATRGTAANPFQLTTGAILSTASFGGLINSGPLTDLNFTQNGVLTPFVHGAATGTPGVEIGGDGAYYTGSTAGASQRLHRAFGRFDYELTDDIRFHAEGIYTQFTQGYTQQNLYLNKINIGYNNAFLATVQPQYQSIIANQIATAPAGTLPSFQFSKMNPAIPPYQRIAREKYYMVNAGLDGKLAGLDWSVDYYHTDSREKLTTPNNINAGRLYAAINAVANPNGGQPVCNAAIENPAVYGSCVPLNLFGPTAANQAAINYITQSTYSVQHYATDDVSGTVTASPFALPAGPVNVALTGEWRRLTYDASSNALPTEVLNCTGIQFNCTSTTSPYTGGSVLSRSPVSQTVTEAAFETEVPVLADAPFARSFTLNGAVRYTHYDTSGSVWTWKGGAVWRINDDITLRGTRSRDIRAPNLYDLFAPATYTLRNFADIHTNTSGLINSVNQGNPNLKPEKADTLTAGIVLKPGFAPGFTFSVDYYRIRIKDAITTIDPFQAPSQAVCEDSGGTSPICALLIRPLPFSNRTGDNYPTLLLQQSLNVASLKTYGIDFEANYATQLLGNGLKLRALVNWQPHLVYNNGPNGTVDVGGAADGVGGLPPIPKVKVVASATYDISDEFRLLVQERWRAALRQNGSRSIYFVDGKVPAVGYTDINLTAKITPAFEAFFNIQNLFDKAPPPFASSGGSVQPNYLGGFAQGDDIEGRYMTVGVRLRM